MNQSFDGGHDGYTDPMLTEHLDMQLVLVAINRIGVYGLENATYFRPYLADHFLQRVADEYPDEIAEVRRDFEIWLSANSPPPESDATA